MNINPEIGKKIQELQMLEQSLQSILMQKQTVQIEMNENNNALEELGKSGDEVYKMIGGIMLRSDKPTLEKELEEKIKITDLRVSSIEKQEKLLSGKIDTLREEINKEVEASSTKDKEEK